MLLLSTITNIGKLGHASLRGWSLIFYGSKQPINKNDPISVSLLPLNNLYNTPYTNNQVVNTTKSNGAAKGNRKMQQQQQKPIQTNAQSTSSSSGGRKNNNGKINGKNENRKNWKQRLTSPRPFTTNRDRKYEIINGILYMNKTLNAITTTLRPVKIPNNNVDSKDNEKLVYVKAPIKAPKQIKEIVSSGSNANATINNDNGKDLNRIKSPSTSILPFKLKQQTTASPIDASVEFVDSFQYTSNPNIPKYFQRYEKIQEFYPEFHPYVLPKASSPVNSGSVAVKPSRDGSKNNHFISSSSNQESSMPFVEESNQTSKKTSASRAQSVATVISAKNGKG